jgi:hypothetical protein
MHFAPNLVFGSIGFLTFANLRSQNGVSREIWMRGDASDRFLRKDPGLSGAALAPLSHRKTGTSSKGKRAGSKANVRPWSKSNSGEIRLEEITRREFFPDRAAGR